MLGAHLKITARFKRPLYHYFWLLLNRQVLTVAYYTGGLAQSGATKSNATLALKTAHILLNELRISKRRTPISVAGRKNNHA